MTRQMTSEVILTVVRLDVSVQDVCCVASLNGGGELCQDLPDLPFVQPLFLVLEVENKVVEIFTRAELSTHTDRRHQRGNESGIQASSASVSCSPP